MILDKILFEQIGPIGESILRKAGLKEPPKNIEEMYAFLEATNRSIQKQDFDGIILGKIFFSFVSGLEVRDRKTTSRIFEDIFSFLFNTEPTDSRSRVNPSPTKELLDYDYLCDGLNWKISDDVCSNKREKADVVLGGYHISLKTLKGYAYDDEDNLMGKKIIVCGEEIKNDENGEVNMGSFSIRALLKGILTDAELENLSDRKGGLGSKPQLRANVFNRIKALSKTDEFTKRLTDFVKFIYDDDLYIVLKSNYLITWILIPAQSLQKTIIDSYVKDEPHFEQIWERWENNNLRMCWHPILDKMDEYGVKYYPLMMYLGKTVHNKEMKRFEDSFSKFVRDSLNEMIKKTKKG